MTVALLIGIIGSSLALAWATEKIVRELNKFAEISGLGRFALTSILVAVATSLPELIVSIIGASKGYAEIAYGNVIGSNIVNIALVTGITAIWSRTIMFEHNLDIKKLAGPITITFLPFLVATDGIISKNEGFGLIAVYLLYVISILRGSQKCNGVTNLKDKRLRKIGLRLMLLSGLLLISGELVVTLAKNVAEKFGISPMFIGLFVVAVGTSLPELVFNLKAVKQHHKDMAVGNIIGSCVANVTLILGISAVISPSKFEKISTAINPGVEYFFVVMVFVFFIRSKKKLERWEGVILVFLFLYYTVVELIIG
jgi:cation:H+ antiporter